MSYRRHDHPRTFAGWAEYLKKSRNGQDRPIGGSATKRVIWGPGRESIHLRLHRTDCVILYRDGSQVINTGGWHTVTTMSFINEHSAARVSGRVDMRVRTESPEITPPKIQKCRSCHGAGTLPNYCQGSRTGQYGWGFRCQGRGECLFNPKRQTYVPAGCRHGRVTPHPVACAHGQLTRHRVADLHCYRCNGDGRRDYGSNAIHYAWNGDPLMITAEGEPVGPTSLLSAREGERSYRSRVTRSTSSFAQYVREQLPRDEVTPRDPDERQDATHRYASHGAYAADLAANPVEPISEKDLLAKIDDLVRSGS